MWQPLPRRLTSALAVIVASCGLLLVNYPATAGAVSTSTIGVYPTGQGASNAPWFTYNLAAGQQTTGSITIANTSNQLLVAQLYPVDAAITTSGAFGLFSQNSPLADVGSWLSLQTSKVTVAAHKTQAVSFVFSVPANASIGPHYGGIIVQPVDQAVQHGTIQIITRLGVRLYETVPGQQHPGLQIGPIKHYYVGRNLHFSVAVTNSGNTTLQPTGTLQVTNLFRKNLSTVTIAGVILPPQASTMLTADLKRVNTIPGRDTASITITYADRLVAQRSTGFWTGSRDIALGVVVEIGLIGGLWLFMRRGM